jgi:hypothetical protein
VEGKKAPPAISFADYCPPPQTFADPRTFRTVTKVKKGETAFQTVKRFRLAEAKKNAAAQRLYNGMRSCRSKRVEMEDVTEIEGGVTSDILAGGLQ